MEKVAEKISKVNTIINDYTKFSITPAMPSNAFINMANFMYTQGFYIEAENLLQSAICFPTKTSNALINLGIIRQTNGNFNEAIEFYKAAYEQDKNNTKALGLWGNCLAMMGKTEDAIEKYKLALEIDDKNSDIYLSWGALLIKLKKYNEAKEKLNPAIEYNKKDARPLYMLSIVEIELGDYDSALDKLLKIIDNTENNFEALHNVAYIYFKKQEYDKAISYAKKVLAIFRHKVETYLLLGDIYAIKNMEEDSLQFYEMAEMNGLKTFFLYISWAVSLQKFNHHERAIEKLHLANNCLKNQNIDEVYARLALSYYKLGNLELAIENKNKALEINPNNYIANMMAGQIEVEKQNYKSALLYLERCKEDFSNKGINYSLMARCYEGLGVIEKSKELYDKSIEYAPNDKAIILTYTRFLYNQQDYETAKKRLKPLAENTDDEIILTLYFDIMYNLAKQNGYKYNLEKAMEIAERLEKIQSEFKLDKEKEELKELLRGYD